MSNIKKYFKQETQWAMLGLEHSKPSDFYLSVWQTNRSPVLQLIFRALLFLTSVGIVLSSMILYIVNGIYGFWFIYLTHWGLLLIVFATGFGTAVAARSYIYGPLSAGVCLPWYVKTFWVSYNIANPTAYLITIFYWTVLYGDNVEEELNHGLDIAVHGINTLLMLLLLLSASQPTRLLHIYQPLLFGLTYVAFGLIYYFAGGVNTNGDPWVYPVINWGKPGSTIGVLTLTGLLLVILHLVTIGLAAIRDAVAARWFKPTDVPRHPEEGVALREQQSTNQQS